MKKIKIVSSAALAVCSMSSVLAPLVSADEEVAKPVVVADDVSKISEELAAKIKKDGAVIESTLMNVRGASDKLDMKSPMVFKAVVHLSEEAQKSKSGVITIDLGKDLEVLSKADGGDEMIRLVADGKKDLREVKLAEALKGADVKPAEKVEETTVEKKDEVVKPAEKVEETTTEKKVEVVKEEGAAESGSKAEAQEEAKSTVLELKLSAEELKHGMLEINFVVKAHDAKKLGVNTKLVLQGEKEAREIVNNLEVSPEGEQPEVKKMITRFVDQDGKEIAPEQSKDAFVDKAEIAGYVFDRTEEKDGIRTHFYKKAAKVMTRFVDENGKDIREPEEGVAKEGKVDGYIFDHQVVDKDGNVTYHYVKAITTRYVNENGEDLQEPVVGKEAAKEVEIEGYEMAERTDVAGVVTYHYRKLTPKKELPKTGVASMLGFIGTGLTAAAGGAVAIFKRRKG